MSLGSPAVPIMSARRVSMFGALFISLGPISMAMYAPAMPEIAEAFGTSEMLAKLTMTLYFGGFAFAQLIVGPVSDAVGRRPVSFCFLGIYLAATLAAPLAPNIEALIAIRFVQGIGASAGIALSRAVVRDVFQGDESSRIMNLIGIMFGLGPAFAPTIGGVIVTASDWRGVFVFMAGYGAILVVLVIFLLRETVPADRDPLEIKALLRSYRRLVTNWQFIISSTVQAGVVGCIFAQSTILPFVLMNQVGLTAAEFGLGMLIQSGGFVAGSLLARVLLRRMPSNRVVPVGIVAVAVGSVVSLLLFFVEPVFLIVMAPITAYMFGVAFISPVMTTVALAPFPRSAGAASSLIGFSQLGTGLLAGTAAALLPDPVLALASLTAFLGAVTLASYAAYRFKIRRAGLT